MKKIAFLFPGQGSQKAGMGKDLYQKFEAARSLFDRADSVTGLPISRLCFEKLSTELTSTINLQPAITTLNLAILACIEPYGIKPSICAGHSLGEYSALAAAGILTTEECLRLVQKRGELMHRESLLNRGTMQAITGLDIDRVSAIVEEAAQYGTVSIANHNSADQIVITGGQEQVEFAGNLALSQGGCVTPLHVSGAWHSPLINGALEEFQTFLSTVEFKRPRCKVLHNVTASEENEPLQIRRLMSQQFCSKVRWFETMVKLINSKVEVYVEIGPGKVLRGLLKKTLPEDAQCKIYNLFNVRTVEAFIEAEA